MDKFVISDSKRQRQAHFATILGALVTAGSMVFGVLTYQRSATENRQAASLGMLQEYLKLSVEHPDLASRAPDQPADTRYTWFATHALFTAETLWNLVGDDPALATSDRLHPAPAPRVSGARRLCMRRFHT